MSPLSPLPHATAWHRHARPAVEEWFFLGFFSMIHNYITNSIMSYNGIATTINANTFILHWCICHYVTFCHYVTAPVDHLHNNIFCGREWQNVSGSRDRNCAGIDESLDSKRRRTCWLLPLLPWQLINPSHILQSTAYLCVGCYPVNPLVTATRLCLHLLGIAAGQLSNLSQPSYTSDNIDTTLGRHKVFFHRKTERKRRTLLLKTDNNYSHLHSRTVLW